MGSNKLPSSGLKISRLRCYNSGLKAVNVTLLIYFFYASICCVRTGFDLTSSYFILKLVSKLNYAITLKHLEDLDYFLGIGVKK